MVAVVIIIFISKLLTVVSIKHKLQFHVRFHRLLHLSIYKYAAKQVFEI
jgi:hypothetical protein